MALFLLLGFVFLPLGQGLSCPYSHCKPYYLGDSICDPVCNTHLCNFDSFNPSSLYSSDCLLACLSTNCSLSLLTNSQCDSECNNELCGFDQGFCGLCNSECTIELLTNKYCDEVCNTPSCDFDNKYCGTCASGCTAENLLESTCQSECNVTSCQGVKNKCFDECAAGCYLDIIGNGICDSVCDNKECEYDNGDCLCVGCDQNITQTCEETGELCECAAGCWMYFNGTSWINSTLNKNNTQCMVSSCSYNIVNQPTSFEVRQQVLYNLYSGNWNYNEIEYLGSGCSMIELQELDCNSELMCTPEHSCYNVNASWCMGQNNLTSDGCLRMGEKCLVCSGTMILDECHPELSDCPAEYISSTELTDLFTEGNLTLTWCLPSSYFYTVFDPKIFYVNYTDEPTPTGSGSISDPFYSLYYAFTHLSASFSLIYLQEGNHFYELNNDVSIYLRKNLNDPIMFKTNKVMHQLSIIGSENGNTVINWKGKLTLSSGPYTKLIIKNVKFVGGSVLNNDCKDSGICSYCPLVLGEDPMLNDRFEKVANESEYLNDCSQFWDTNIFEFFNQALVENVEFFNFRYQFKTFILAKGGLELKNVSFVHMQAKDSGHVIELFCEKDCIKNDFLFSGGLVQDLNSGYQDTGLSKSGNFLLMNEIHSGLIQNVTFIFNFVVRGADNSAYLIKAQNFLGTFGLIDCVFDTNYVDSLMIVDVSTLKYNDLQVDYKGYSKVYSQRHFFVYNTKFLRIYTVKDFLTYLMKSINQNIGLVDVELLNVVSRTMPLINFAYTGTPNWQDYEGGVMRYTGKPLIYIEKRSVVIENLNILNSTSSRALICLNGILSSLITNITVIDVENKPAPIFKEIVKRFVESGRYLELLGNTNDFSRCLTGIEVLNGYKIEISQLNFYNLGIKSLLIENIENFLNISHVNLTNFQFNSSLGSGMTIINSKVEVNLENILLAQGENSEGSIILVENTPKIRFISSNTQNLTSKSSSSILIHHSSDIEIQDLNLTNTKSETENGGCLSIIFPHSASYVSISNSTFKSCASYGQGGCLYLSGQSSVQISINTTTFIECESSTGSSIYISEELSIVGKSTLSQIKMSKCINYNGFLVVDKHKAGFLKFENWEIADSIGQVLLVEYNFVESSLILTGFIVSGIVSNDGLFYFYAKLNSNIEINSLKVARCKGNKTFVLNVENASLNVKDLVISTSIGGVQASGKSKVSVTNGKFTSLFQAILLEHSSFTCNSCEFENNQVIIHSFSSVFSFTNCKMYNNSAEAFYSPLIFVQSSPEPGSVFDSCRFSNNRAKNSDFFTILNTHLKFLSTHFYKNSASNKNSPGLKIVSSDISIQSSKFSTQISSIPGPFLSISQDSQVFINNSNFTNGISATDAGCIYSENSDLTIESCNFTSNSAQSLGGSLFLSTSSVSIHSCSFQYNSAGQGSALYATKASLRLANSTFTLSTGLQSNPACTLYTTQSALDLTTSNFLKGSKISALCIEDSETSIASSTFSEFNNTLAALSFKSSFVSIKNSKVFQNSCQGEGGGINSENSNVTLINSSVYGNQALKGGGIFFRSPSCAGCTLNLFNLSKIFNNSAEQGGGVQWFDSIPNIKSSSVHKNSALYGPDFASAGLKLSTKYSRQLRSVDFDYEINSVSPGQAFLGSLNIGVYDFYDDLVSVDNSSKLRIEPIEEFSGLELGGSLIYTAKNGVFYITGFIPYGMPGSRYVFNGISDLPYSDLLGYQNSTFVQISFRNCGKGEKIETNACRPCPELQYTYEASKTCKTCPVGGICPGGSALYPGPGYYKPTPDSEKLYKCAQKEACKGNLTGNNSICATGYTGVKCGVCEKGFLMSPLGYCEKCSDININIGLILATLASLAFCSYMLSSSVLQSALDYKQYYTAYIKLLMDFLHTGTMIAALNLNWPDYVQTFLNVFKYPGTSIEFVLSTECFINETDENYTENSYYYRLAAVISLPFVIYLISAIVWLGFGFLNETYLYLKRELFLTFFSVFYIFYPNIINMCFSHYVCEDVEGFGEVLISNPGVQCWNSRHKKYSLMFALPGAIIWGLTIPFLCLVVILKRRRYLNNIENSVSFGFYLIGYRKTKFYWEFLIIFRKFVFIILINYLNLVSNTVQGLVILFALFFFLLIQYENNPFSAQVTSHLQTEILTTWAITVFFGLLYLTDDINSGFKIFLFCVICAMNAYFLLIWTFFTSNSILEILLKSIPRLKEILKKGDAFQEDFNNEDLTRKGVLVDPSDGEIIYTFMTFDKEKPKKLRIRNMKHLYVAALFDSEVAEDLSEESFYGDISDKDSLNTDSDEINLCSPIHAEGTQLNLSKLDIFEELKLEIPEEISEYEGEKMENTGQGVNNRV